ncbi:MAG: ArnT family glycosyltransferase [bacterium]
MFRERTIVVIGVILFTFLFFYFYPINIGIVDETAYLSMTYAFQNGKLYYDSAGIESAPASMITNGHLVSRYPPGNSILLLPFSVVHWKWIFLRGYILMIIGLIIFILILSHYRLPLYYALLFLFHPSLLLYSRTIMSDLPSTIFSLLGLLFLMKRRIFLSSILFGLSIAIRYPIVLVPASSGLIFLYRRQIKALIRLLVGVLIGIVPLLLYNIICFKTFTGPVKANIVGFSLANLPAMFIQFFVSMNILYPLLFITAFKTKIKEKWFFILPALLFLLFFSLQYFMDTGKNFLETIILGQRYMLPVVPFLLIPYIEVLNQIRLNKIVLIFCLGLIVLGACLHNKHEQYLKQQSAYQNKLYQYTQGAETIVCNKDVYELINPFIKSIKWISFESEGKLLQFSISEDNQSVYLACLAREEYVRKIFVDLLNKFPARQEIYSENIPYYFSIWQLKEQLKQDL